MLGFLLSFVSRFFAVLGVFFEFFELATQALVLGCELLVGGE